MTGHSTVRAFGKRQPCSLNGSSEITIGDEIFDRPKMPILCKPMISVCHPIPLKHTEYSDKPRDCQEGPISNV
ncbi:hypothetical protein EMIT0P291_130028 [Pseudomonas sp. IT-P291]